MKKVNPFVIGVMVMLALGSGCAANKTPSLTIPPAKDKGPLRIVVTPVDGMDEFDLNYVKDTITDDFGEAGYDPVKIVPSRGNTGAELDIKVEQYEQTKDGTACYVVSGGCTYICPCMAPCLAFPRYSTVRFNFTTRVEAFRNGRSRFTERFSEASQVSASLVEGNKSFSVKEVAINNTVARIMNKMNE